MRTLAIALLAVSATAAGACPVDFSPSNCEVHTVPEPGTWLLMAVGLLGVLVYRIKSRR